MSAMKTQIAYYPDPEVIPLLARHRQFGYASRNTFIDACVRSYVEQQSMPDVDRARVLAHEEAKSQLVSLYNLLKVSFMGDNGDVDSFALAQTMLRAWSNLAPENQPVDVLAEQTEWQELWDARSEAE